MSLHVDVETADLPEQRLAELRRRLDPGQPDGPLRWRPRRLWSTHLAVGGAALVSLALLALVLLEYAGDPFLSSALIEEGALWVVVPVLLIAPLAALLMWPMQRRASRKTGLPPGDYIFASGYVEVRDG